MIDPPGLVIDPTAEVSPDARIFPSVRGTRITIGAHTRVMEFAIIRAVGGSGDVVIGAHCFLNPHCVLYSGSGIEVGDNVLIGPGACVVPANHAFARRDVPIRLQGFAPRGGVVIEDDVWLGANCVVLDGSVIRRGAVVAAGGVVVGEVPAYAVAAGVPARVVKERP